MAHWIPPFPPELLVDAFELALDNPAGFFGGSKLLTLSKLDSELSKLDSELSLRRMPVVLGAPPFVDRPLRMEEAAEEVER